MASFDKQSLREMTDQELRNMIADHKNMLRTKRFAHTVSPLENPVELRVMRKDIARLNTELNRRKKEATAEANNA